MSQLRDFVKGFVWSVFGIIVATVCFIFALPLIIIWCLFLAIGMALVLPFTVYKDIATKGLRMRGENSNG